MTNSEVRRSSGATVFLCLFEADDQQKEEYSSKSRSLLQPVHDDAVPPVHITESAKDLRSLLAGAAAHIMLPQRRKGASDAGLPINSPLMPRCPLSAPHDVPACLLLHAHHPAGAVLGCSVEHEAAAADEEIEGRRHHLLLLRHDPMLSPPQFAESSAEETQDASSGCSCFSSAGSCHKAKGRIRWDAVAPHTAPACLLQHAKHTAVL